MVSACTVLPPEYFNRISLNLHLHLHLFFLLQVQQEFLGFVLEWKSRPLGSLSGFSTSWRALSQSIKGFRSSTGLQHAPSLGRDTPQHSALACRVVFTCISGSCAQGLTRSKDQGRSCANVWWFFLPAQRWRLVPHPQKLFNPLDVSLPFNKCHCTSSSISASTGHGCQDGQVPRAQWVTHITEHLMSCVSPITLLSTESLLGGSGWSSHTSSLGLSFSAASQLHSTFLPASSSSPWRPVTSVSLSFVPFSWPWARGVACIRLMGRKEISSSVCLARHQPVHWDCHNSTQPFCAWFTHKINYSQTCKWQHQDSFAVKTQPCCAKLHFCTKTWQQ